MNNDAFFEDKEKDRLELVDLIVNDKILGLQGSFEKSLSNLEDDILKLYDNLDKDKKIFYQDTFHNLKSDELVEFKNKMSESLKEVDKKENIKELLDKKRINKLDALKYNLSTEGLKLEKMFKEEILKTFNSIYFDSNQHSMFGHAILKNKVTYKAKLPKLDSSDKLLKSNWSGKDYKEKVDNLINNYNNKLEKTLIEGLIRGEDPKVIKENLEKKLLGKLNKDGSRSGGIFYECKRLIRTESAFISEQAKLDSYKKEKIVEYKYLAKLDFKSSEICKKLNKSIFKIKDAKVSVNYPPMHCFCRSTTIPVINEEIKNKGTYKGVGDIEEYCIWKEFQYNKEKNSKSKNKQIPPEKELINFNKTTDLLQYSNYKKALGKEFLYSLDEFKKLKYEDYDKYKILKGKYNNQVSWLMGLSVDRIKSVANSKITNGYSVKPIYSTIEERLKVIPTKDSKFGTWLGEIGNSTFISNDERVKYLLDKEGLKGIEYKSGMPDFSKFVIAEFEINSMTIDRSDNFRSANEILVKKLEENSGIKCRISDIEAWLTENRYTWHELNDGKTIQLLPSIINAPIFKHLGGVGELNKIERRKD